MLQVTDRAAEYLRESLSRKDEDLPAAIRIVRTEEGYRLVLDDPKDGDQVFGQEGHNYLLVGTEVGEALSGATIDVQESPQGLALALTTGGSPPAQSPPPSPPQP